MQNKKLVLYLHLVWATWDRNPWITPQNERLIYRCIVNQIQKLGCQVLVINGVEDHIHLVIKLRSTVTIAELVKKAKGVSSRFINNHGGINDHFKWQGGYGAFTVSRWDLPKIINYVKNQKDHHQGENTAPDLEY